MHTTEWELLWRLGLALVLSTVIGLEREYRQKSAGLRTYTLVGLGSALAVASTLLYLLVTMTHPVIAGGCSAPRSRPRRCGSPISTGRVCCGTCSRA